MTSRNFEFLRPERPELADLAAFAERYAFEDPVSALLKLRSLAEALTWGVYRQLGFRPPLPDDFINLLTDWQFKSATPKLICDQLHALRKAGNKAAHANHGDTQTALLLLEQSWQLAAWFAVRFCGVQQASIGVFRQLVPMEAAEGRLKHELERQREQLDAMLAELESTRAQYQAAEKKLDELQSLAQAGQSTLSLLQFDEATTRRRLIDVALTEAGWDVGPNLSTTEVGQEYELTGQPTATGKGYADYVLWGDDGRPLAVIEAKRTMKDAEQGRKQAELYADALEAKFSHRPIIFYTNGHEIHVWDDAAGYPPRRLYGFYSKDTLQYRGSFQRTARKPLDSVPVRTEIVERIYQLEAIKRVTEKFTSKSRRALLVQATGTGKTRVAIAIADLLIRAGWVRRVLFLCDRRELRKQAKNAFAEFLKEPLTILNAATAKDSNQRIYIATYPGIQNAFDNFDPGFFDLVIADESHRSIYNAYRDLFKYFDALQIGLTATPVDFISRNTYDLFDCPDLDPTSSYSLDDGVAEGYLVPYEVFSVTTSFLREGIRYNQLTEEQRRQIEEDGIDPDLIDHDAADIDWQVFNEDTNRFILRNLMDNGLRDKTGQRMGKTIIFARNHDHAMLLRKLFDEMYPQYGGKVCQVIDYQMERAEQLIDDFKGDGSNPDLAIAISVDMLDTGIDVPPIVNLVFAKPVKSKVKFWQMIGRGTRLCKDLYGPGQDKTKFRIFDHWGNFEFFGQNTPQAQPGRPRSLMEQVFAARVALAEATLQAAQPDSFNWVVRLVAADIASLPDDSISVRESFIQRETVMQPGRLEAWGASTVDVLSRDIAPLMQWIEIGGAEHAYRLDLLFAQMQLALLRGAGRFADLRAEFLNRINSLQMNLNPVRDKAAVIQEVRSGAFWDIVTSEQLERVRLELRGIMQFQIDSNPPRPKPIIYDIKEDADDFRYEQRSTLNSAIDMVAYRHRVEEALKSLFDTNPTLARIRRCEPVTQADLDALVSLVLTRHPDINLNDLTDFYGQAAVHLDDVIRSIIGMDPAGVQARFASFVQKYPALTSQQTQFIRLLVNHISRYGKIELGKLYEQPFISVHGDGIDGVFADAGQIQDLVAIINSFNQSQTGDFLTT